MATGVGLQQVVLIKYLPKTNPGWSDDAWEYALNGHATAVGSSSIHATTWGEITTSDENQH